MNRSGAHDMTVRFRGVRGSTPSPGLSTARYGGNTSCIEVRAGGEILILDAGTGIRTLGTDLLAEFGSASLDVTLLMSHMHWDHIQGLPFFAPAYSASHRIRLMAAPGAGAKLLEALSNQMNPINFPVGLDQMKGLAAIEEIASNDVTLGAFRVQLFALNHPGGCAGFRIEAAGRSFAYLPDHEPFQSVTRAGHDVGAKAQTEALIDFVRGVDLLILDTQYTEPEYASRLGWGHGCLPDSVFIAQGAGVKQFALFHHDPSHTDLEIDAMVEAARALVPVSLVVTAAQEDEIIVPGAIPKSLVRSDRHPLFSAAALL